MEGALAFENNFARFPAATTTTTSVTTLVCPPYNTSKKVVQDTSVWFV